MLTTVESGENEMGEGEESHRRTRDSGGPGQLRRRHVVGDGRFRISEATLHCVRSKESTRALDNETARLNKGEGNLQHSCCCEYSAFRFRVRFG